MLGVIRKHCNAANVVSLMALVLSLAGGAFAATGGRTHAASHKGHNKKSRVVIITSTRQISKTVLAALKGNVGPAGPQGSAGPEGKEGKQGLQGLQGLKGDKGDTGTQGVEGKEGSPWTAGGTLPSEKTETGAWSYAHGENDLVNISISFAIPLAEELDETHVHYIEPFAASTTECPGTVVEPKAEPGNLCVYAKIASGVTGSPKIVPPGFLPPPYPGGKLGAGETGAVLFFAAETAAGSGYGSWAVTAP